MTSPSEISVVFFGSGPVAGESLRLLAQDFTIEAVITKPRPEHHKGSVPVLELADKLGIQTFTPTNKKELSELFARRPVSSRLGIVIDYGIIISQDVIDYFPLGIINSHFSLLPEWRGADPITFAILSGQKQTGVSLMRITAGLDEGPILAFGVYDIKAGETTPSLTSNLIHLSHALLRDHLPRYVDTQKVVTQEQAAAVLGRSPEPTFSHKLTKEDGLLDFNKPAAQLEREVRAYLGWPGSRTNIASKDIVVTEAEVVDGQGEPGNIWRSSKRFGIYTTEGIFEIRKLKPAGKQEMPAEAFLAGYGSQLSKTQP